jgi:hypothetical protein
VSLPIGLLLPLLLHQLIEIREFGQSMGDEFEMALPVRASDEKALLLLVHVLEALQQHQSIDSLRKLIVLLFSSMQHGQPKFIFKMIY